MVLLLSLTIIIYIFFNIKWLSALDSKTMLCEYNRNELVCNVNELSFTVFCSGKTKFNLVTLYLHSCLLSIVVFM